MKGNRRRILIILLLASLGVVVWIWLQRTVPPSRNQSSSRPPGSILDAYRDVAVYENGEVVTTSHGKHYAPDGYYYGQKWQCVEYIKRFYHDAKNHAMPSVWGHAKDFFDPEIGHGELNPERGLLQFRNGGSEPPRADDLLVFRTGSLGHVAIISRVGADDVEVVQQNVHGFPRARHELIVRDGGYTIGRSKQPAGWLRLP